MGSNVFGTPISQETLKAMPEYHDKKVITAADRAIVALEMKNAEGKDINARKFVEFLETRFGHNVSTMCMVYNATGDPVTLADAHSWTGRICESPYPMVILNGQWGVFLHGRVYGNSECSEAAVVYNGKNLDWMFSFSNRVDNAINKVYTEIFEQGKFIDKDWNNIKDHLNKEKTTHKSTRGGAIMFATIGDISKCAVEAILTTSEALSNQ